MINWFPFISRLLYYLYNIFCAGSSIFLFYLVYLDIFNSSELLSVSLNFIVFFS